MSIYHIRKNNRVEQKLSQKTTWRYLTAFSILGILVFSTTYFYFQSSSKIAKANSNAPSLSFSNPTLISGTDGSAGAVYRFSNVGTGLDAHVTLVSLNAGAQLSNIDHFTAGYNQAWQPFVNANNNKTSYIEWKITFKKAGTNTDTTLTDLSVTAIDVDGGSQLREFVESTPPVSYARDPSTLLDIVNLSATTINATGQNVTVTDIDTSAKHAMFQLNFKNVNNFTYRTGSISTDNDEETRQFCLYFRSFFSSSTPLPINLISFNGEVMNENKIDLKWVTACETDNDYFIIEKSIDKKSFELLAKIKGAGNSSKPISYSLSDNKPAKGINYYRLNQVDFNGKLSNVKTIYINNQQDKSPFTIRINSSNPFKDKIAISFQSSYAGSVKLSLINADAKEIRSVKLEANLGSNEFVFENLGELNYGTYLVRIDNGKQTASSIKAVKY